MTELLMASVMTLIAACSSDSNGDQQSFVEAGGTHASSEAGDTSRADAAATDVVSVVSDAGNPSQGPGSLAPDAGRSAPDAAVLEAGLATTPLDGGSLSVVDAGVLDASTAGRDAGETSHHDATLDAAASVDAAPVGPCGGLAPSYASGLDASGPNGVRVTLNEAEPAPPVVGVNVFYLSIQDDAGNTVNGVELTVTPYMPQHHHGSPSVPQSEQLENGTFRVTQVEFTMPGYWEITIDVNGGAVSDSVRLRLCI